MYPSDRQMYPYGYMHPKLGTPELQEKSCTAVLDRDKRSVGVKVHIIRFGWNLYELFRSNNFLETFKVRNYFSFGQVCFWSADLGRVFVAKKSVNTTAGTWLQTFFKKKNSAQLRSEYIIYGKQQTTFFISLQSSSGTKCIFTSETNFGSEIIWVAKQALTKPANKAMTYLNLSWPLSTS